MRHGEFGCTVIVTPLWAGWISARVMATIAVLPNTLAVHWTLSATGWRFDRPGTVGRGRVPRLLDLSLRGTLALSFGIVMSDWQRWR
jgi:hypothetical protein